MNWIVIVYVVACAVLLVYYLYIFRKIYTVKAAQYFNDETIPVSVIICAKNEAKNLSQNLKVVLMQSYPKYEVIVVNDQSTDDSAAILEGYQQRNPHLKIITIAPEEAKKYAGKKNALQRGIAAASYEHIIVTDADCQPETTKWITHLSNRFFAETAFVLGYAPFFKRKGFWNQLMQFENSKTALFYLSFAANKLPILGIGRNMAFTKKAYCAFNNLEKHGQILSGDDDLLVNSGANAQNTELVLHPDSFVFSEAPENFKKWINQKKRHLESAKFYKWQHLFGLHLYNFVNFIFWGLSIYLISIKSFFIALFFILLLVKIGNDFSFSKKFKTTNPFILKILSEIVFIFLEILLLLLFIINPKKNWK